MLDFDSLYSTHSAHVRGVVRRYLRAFPNDTDDVEQLAWLDVWRGLDGFGGRANIRTWIHSVAANRSLQWLRVQRRPKIRCAVSLDEMLERVDKNGNMVHFPYKFAMRDRTLELTPERLALDGALGVLMQREREVFHDHFVLGAKYREMPGGHSLNGSVWFRARRKLREELGRRV